MEDLGRKALAVVLIVLTICIGAVVLDNLSTNIQTTAGSTIYANIANESMNISNYTATGTWTYFSRDEIVSGSMVIVNKTSNAGIALGNFTIDYTLGTIGFVTNNQFTSSTKNSNTSITNISYTYLDPTTSTAYNVTKLGLAGMETFGNWINIIVIMLIVGTIIGLIYGVFRFVGGNTGGMTY